MNGITSAGRKLLNCSIAIALALSSAVGFMALAPQKAHAGIISTAILISILNDEDEIAAADVLDAVEISETLKLSHNNDVLSENIGAPFGIDHGHGYAYLMGESDPAVQGRYVALSLDDGAKAVIDDPHLWSDIYNVLNADEAQAVEFDSLVCDLSGISEDFEAAPIPIEVGILLIAVVIVEGIIVLTVGWRRGWFDER